MRQGMEVSPVLYENQLGEEFVGDFEVDYHGGHGAEIDTAAFANYNYENPDLWDDNDLDSEYTAALFDLHPGLPDAIEWAQYNLPEEANIEYNNAIDSGDYTWINEAIENLLIQYENAEEYEYEYDDSDEYEQDEEIFATYDLEELGIDQEVIEETVQDLMYADAEGEEMAQEFAEAASAFEEIGNQCGMEMATLAAQFHMGQIDAQSAIEYMANNYDDEEVIGNYLYLFGE